MKRNKFQNISLSEIEQQQLHKYATKNDTKISVLLRNLLYEQKILKKLKRSPAHVVSSGKNK